MADADAVFIDFPAHTRIVALTNAVDSLAKASRLMLACLPDGHQKDDAISQIEDACTSVHEIVGVYWRDCGEEIMGKKS